MASQSTTAIQCREDLRPTRSRDRDRNDTGQCLGVADAPFKRAYHAAPVLIGGDPLGAVAWPRAGPSWQTAPEYRPVGEVARLARCTRMTEPSSAAQHIRHSRGEPRCLPAKC